MYFATFAFYNEDNANKRKEDNPNCVICLLSKDTATNKIEKLTDFVHIVLSCPCNPPIHFQCVNQWMNISSTCPICRKPMYSKWYLFWNKLLSICSLVHFVQLVFYYTYIIYGYHSHHQYMDEISF